MALLAGVATLLSSCSNSGLSLARQACAHVDTSIRLYVSAEHGTDATKVDRERTEATVELEAALPLAAAANSDDAQWNPLMTTLQEIGRTPESELVPALQAQCAAAANPTTGQVAATSPTPGRTPTSPTSPTTTRTAGTASGSPTTSSTAAPAHTTTTSSPSTPSSSAPAPTTSPSTRT